MNWFIKDCSSCHKVSYTTNRDIKEWRCPYCENMNIENIPSSRLNLSLERQLAVQNVTVKKSI